MKIHPNNEMNRMLKNGSARVIVYKRLPYTIAALPPEPVYQTVSEDALDDTIQQIREQDTPTATSVPAEIPVITQDPSAQAKAADTVPEPAMPEAALAVTPEPAIPDEAQAATPEAATQDEAQAATPEAATQDEEQAATPEAATQGDAQAVKQETEFPDTTQALTSEPTLDDARAATPEPASPAEMPDITPEQAALDVTREAIPDHARAVSSEPSPPDDTQGTMMKPEQPDNAQGVKVNILQPESAPGGLIAEIDFTSDPSGLVFGATPGHVSAIPVITPVPVGYGGLPEEDPSYPPYVNFTCFNRLGLTIKTLTNLLDSDENFELNIIDSNSQDNSWDYIQSLNDPRIKSRIRFEKNCGPIFAVNFALSRRKPNQYFIVIDSDTFIKTKNWIAHFMEVFNAFPEVGLLGLMRDKPYPRYMPPIIPRVNGPFSYLQLKNADINAEMDFVPGQLQCLRPALIREIGYWSEENGFGDAELSPRIVHYTNFTAGFLTTIEIDMTQKITCDECLGKEYCKLDRSICDCFMLSKRYNKNESYVAKNTWKFKQTFQELSEGNRTVYCASIHDPESMRTHKYNADWAYENINHYILNAN